jgi:hypothetical protein
MAAITILLFRGVSTNTTTNKLPYNADGVFRDSMLFQDTTDVLYTTYNRNSVAGPQGLLIDNSIGNFQFGDIDGVSGNNQIVINSSNNEFYLYSDGLTSINGTSIIELNTNEIVLNGALIFGTTGGIAPFKYLGLTINGSKYKIQLLLP